MSTARVSWQSFTRPFQLINTELDYFGSPHVFCRPLHLAVFRSGRAPLRTCFFHCRVKDVPDSFYALASKPLADKAFIFAFEKVGALVPVDNRIREEARVEVVVLVFHHFILRLLAEFLKRKIVLSLLILQHSLYCPRSREGL